jgi:formylmethanofuran dehydrogenase subunit E-like metal-binding protein
MQTKRRNGSAFATAVIAWITAIAVVVGCCVSAQASPKGNGVETTGLWESIGEKAATEALTMMGIRKGASKSGNLVVLSNAGYAEVNGCSTPAALDGLSRVTGASRGRCAMLEIHSTSGAPLWFAVFDKSSGMCSYLEMDASAVNQQTDVRKTAASKLFRIRAVENIAADYLYSHAQEFKEKSDRKVFGGNEFRIITIANAVAAGAPVYAVRAFEFHDHYCPGVTSGILMVNYLKKRFPPNDGGYFIHSVSPWCKEDALLVLLNTTPGKNGYALDHPTDEDKAKWKPEAKDACTIVYRENKQTGRWDGQVLGFKFGETGCPDYGNPMLGKLCADLWYLNHMDEAEKFLTVIKEFNLPEGVAPKTWARPGVDPMEKLDLIEDK